MKKFLVFIFIGIIGIGLLFVLNGKKNNEILHGGEDLNNTSINNDHQGGLLPPKNLGKLSNTGEIYQGGLMPPVNLRK